MFIKVKLLNGFHESLWYKKPEEWKAASLIGSIVRVPLRTQHIPALVIYESLQKPLVNFEIKLAESIEPIPDDPTYQKFIAQLSNYYQVSPLHLVKRIRSFVHQKEQRQPTLGAQGDRVRKNTDLTPEQQHIVDSIQPQISTPCYMPSLIHGVTSSGKTEIYKELIKTAIQENKSALFLLPEVTLAIEFEKRLRKELPSEIVTISFHSGTAIKQKRLLWQRLLNSQPTLIIGVHIPILLPIPHLGLIIIDEEHDVGYQEKKHPKINSKEAAIWRANLANIPIVLGSATPSISSLYNVKKRNWHFFQLKTRFTGALPTIKTVLLKEDKNKRKQFWISNELKQAITDRLAKKEQTIIFLNRRGYSFFVQCRACNFIPECPSCSVSLTLHNTNTLNCHYCEYSIPLPEKCITCKKDKFLKKGVGTQQIVSILEEMFINAKIARADLDTTTQKKQWQQIMIDFGNGDINILVGTQTITKGYHFPHVTLVGIIWADLNLHFPIFNAAETTLQQIIQVAGRAGRQSDRRTRSGQRRRTVV